MQHEYQIFFLFIFLHVGFSDASPLLKRGVGVLGPPRALPQMKH